MHTLIYLSASSTLYSKEDIIDILKKSRSNNLALKVTGLLLYHEGSIIQILEGEEEVVRALYDKIRLDSRHKSMIKMLDKSISDRSFADWSMGFKQISDDDWSELNAFLDVENKINPPPITDSRSADVVSLITSFYNTNRFKM
ncbi:MAG: BLUF domain-containing protein [Chryseolinea sp.]